MIFRIEYSVAIDDFRAAISSFYADKVMELLECIDRGTEREGRLDGSICRI